MKLLSHGPEPCASANSAISAYHVVFITQIVLYQKHGQKASENLKKEKCADCMAGSNSGGIYDRESVQGD